MKAIYKNKNFVAINQYLKGFNLELRSEKTRNGLKRFSVASIYSQTYMGCDGETHWRLYFWRGFIEIKSVKELSLDIVLAKTTEDGETLEQISENILSKKAKDDAEIEARRKKYKEEEAKKEAELADARSIIDDETKKQRINEMKYDHQDALNWYNDMQAKNGMLVSDDYRDNFGEVVSNPHIWIMAMDLMAVKDPKKLLDGYDMMLTVNARARQLGVQFSTIGVVKHALQYLVRGAS